MGCFMLTNQEPDRNIEDLTDTEIYNLIRYLEPNPQSANEMDGDRDKDNGVVICVCLYIALLGCLAFVWLFWR
jgi:hypothetical protein